MEENHSNHENRTCCGRMQVVFMKMKNGSKGTRGQFEKTKVHSESLANTANIARRKQVEDEEDLGQSDDRLQDTSKVMNKLMVTYISMAVLKYASYKTRGSDRTPTGAILEMKFLNQKGESMLKDFNRSMVNHGKGSIAGQLTQVEYNWLTVSKSIKQVCMNFLGHYN